jgi:hypothetical protein
MPFSLPFHRPYNGLRGNSMTRPQETFKKRAKDQKRREKQERKMQRRLDKKEQATEGGKSILPDEFPVETENRP